MVSANWRPTAGAGPGSADIAGACSGPRKRLPSHPPAPHRGDLAGTRTPMNSHPLDPTAAFAALGRIKLSDTDLSGVLNQISELAQRTIPGAEDVSVTLVRTSGAYTAAFTSETALNLDEWQYEQGRGPCVDAAQAAA